MSADSPSRSEDTHSHSVTLPAKDSSSTTALLSLPSLESIFFRSVCLHRPTGPVRAWAVVLIAQELNDAIRRLEYKKEARAQRQTQRVLKRKRRHDDTDDSETKRYKSSTSPHARRSIKKEADQASQSPIAGGQEPDQSDAEDSSSSDDDEDSDDEELAAELEHPVLLSPDILRTTSITPEIVWAKLLEHYDLAALDELEAAAITPEEMTSHAGIRERGYTSAIKERPSTVRVKFVANDDDEESEEERSDESEGSPPPIDFALVPGLAYESLVTLRAIEDEQAVQIGADTATDASLSSRSSPANSSATTANRRGRTPSSYAGRRRSGRGATSTATHDEDEENDSAADAESRGIASDGEDEAPTSAIEQGDDDDGKARRGDDDGEEAENERGSDLEDDEDEADEAEEDEEDETHDTDGGSSGRPLPRRSSSRTTTETARSSRGGRNTSTDTPLSASRRGSARAGTASSKTAGSSKGKVAKESPPPTRRASSRRK